MSSKGTFIRIMMSEADGAVIKDIFEGIDEATKTFQVISNLLSNY